MITHKLMLLIKRVFLTKIGIKDDSDKHLLNSANEVYRTSAVYNDFQEEIELLRKKDEEEKKKRDSIILKIKNSMPVGFWPFT